MKFHHRAALLLCCVVLLTGLLTPPGAVAWGPPQTMDWGEFCAQYAAAGAADAPDHVVTLTGSLNVPRGVYELGATPAAVRVETPGRYSIVVPSESTLTVNNPNLTISARENEMSAVVVSGGYLDLKSCAIETVNCPALFMMADGTHLATGGAGRVSIDVTYDRAAMEGETRAGFVSIGYNVPFQLHNVDLTVSGGDAAISVAADLELYHCTVRAVGEPPAPAISFFFTDSTLTADADTVVEPEYVPPVATPPAGHVVEAVSADGGGSGWCLSGTPRGELADLLPAAGTVWCAEDEDGYYYEDGVPLSWALEALADPLGAGEYLLRGVPDASVLEGFGIQNPGGIAGAYTLTVWDPVPPGRMTVASNPVSEGVGRLTTYQNLPPLAAAGATALYAEYSPDGAHWSRVRVNTRYPYEEPVYSENLLEAPWVDEETVDFTVTVPADQFYTRLLVEGGPFAGVSNTVEHGVITPPAIEDDDGGGDRGGGGQGEHDRPGRVETGPEEPPAPQAVPSEGPEPSPAAPPPPEAAPEVPPPSPDPAEPSTDPAPAPGRQAYPRAEAASAPEEEPTAQQALAVRAAPPAPTPSAALAADDTRRSPEAPAGAGAPQTTAAPAPAHWPGFAVAAAATAAVVLGGGAWFYWRGRQK